MDMDTTKLASILGSDTLPADMLEALQDAFNEKIVESEKRIRAETETAIREEFSARFENDKDTMIKALDLSLTQAVKEQARAKDIETKKLTETRVKLEKAIVETKKVFKTKLNEHVNTSDRFVFESLKKSITALEAQKKELSESKIKLENAFKTVKSKLAEQQTARLNKMDEFVIRRLTAELEEFQIDRNALVETRAKLIKESKDKLVASQKLFVKEAARKVEEAINRTLKREMKEMHEDIELSRQNTFGRKMFEAYASEYMTSYLVEGTEVKKLQNVLEAKEQELSSTKTALTESTKKIADAARRQQISEDNAKRSKIMTELLSPLRGDKRSSMASMLEGIKTDALVAAFDRFSPIVLSETRKPVDRKSNVLMENRAPVRRTVNVNGDKQTRDSETLREQNEFNADLDSIMRLSGMTK